MAVRVGGPKDPYMAASVRPGTKVRFVAQGGYDGEKDSAKQVLTLGQLYTVAYVTVGEYDSRVILEEFPSQAFNICLFYKKTAKYKKE